MQTTLKITETIIMTLAAWVSDFCLSVSPFIAADYLRSLHKAQLCPLRSLGVWSAKAESLSFLLNFYGRLIVRFARLIASPRVYSQPVSPSLDVTMPYPASCSPY